MYAPLCAPRFRHVFVPFEKGDELAEKTVMIVTDRNGARVTYQMTHGHWVDVSNAPKPDALLVHQPDNTITLWRYAGKVSAC